MPAFQRLGSFSLVSALVLLVTVPGFAQTTTETIEAMDATSLTPDAVMAQRRRSRNEDRIRYFGIGGTIGVSDDGDTELGEGGFSLVGRFPVSDQLSIHSASVLGGDSFTSFALTTDFSGFGTDGIQVQPFVGAGIGLEIDDFEISPMVTAGVDVPINDLITATGRVNAAFNDGTDIGVVLGVGVDVLGLF